MAARRRKRWRTAAAVGLLLVAFGAAASWKMTQRPQRPVHVSQDPYAPRVSLTVDFEELDAEPDSEGVRHHRVAVVVENRGESSLECLKVAQRVLDVDGAELRNDRRELRCQTIGDPLWPGEREVTGFMTPALEKGQRLDLVVEELTLGPPPSGAPALRPMTVSVSPTLGVPEVTPFLLHELRSEHLDQWGWQSVVFTVTALPPLVVTDLAYELRLLGPGGEQVGSAFAGVASLARADYRRLPALKPGRPVAVSINARADKPAGARWQLIVTRFATRQAP